MMTDPTVTVLIDGTPLTAIVAEATTAAVVAVKARDDVVNMLHADIYEFITPDVVAGATLSGAGFQFEVEVNPRWGEAITVETQYASVDDAGVYPGQAWASAARVSSRVWRSAAVDTMRYQASLAEAKTEAVRASTLSDVWWSFRARVTLVSGAVFVTPTHRIRSSNAQLTGTEPTWKPADAFQADYTSTAAYIKRYTDMHPSGSAGSAYGKELGATQIVLDPVPEVAGGHRNHGNVVLGNVPKDYVSKTANMVSAYSPRKYSALGDQAPSGGLRWQYVMPPKFVEGDMAYHGRAIRIDPEFPTPNLSHVSIGQVFGEPWEWGLTLMLDAHQKPTEHGDTKPDTWQIWGGRLNPYEQGKLFEMPFYRGEWVDVIEGIGFSADGRLGWLEIYTRQPGVQGGALVQHTFPNGSKRLNLVTLPQGFTGHQFHDHIYRSATAFPGEPQTGNRVRAMFAKQALGPTAESVDPHSY